MTAQFLIDTNVLLYAASNAAADQHKRLIARRILSEPGSGFSAQVLQEFYAAAVTKQHLNHGQDYDGVRVVNPFLPGVMPPPT